MIKSLEPISPKADRRLQAIPPKRIALLCTHPVQYFAPFFRELSNKNDIEIRVFFGSLHGAIDNSYDPDFQINIQWDCDVLKDYQWTQIGKKSLEELSRPTSLWHAIRTTKSILRWEPDYVIIFAYSPFFIAACSVILAIAGHKILLRADTSDNALKRSKLKKVARDITLKMYYRFVHHIFPIGSDSYDHYLRLGVQPQKLTTVPYAIDKEVIKPLCEENNARSQESNSTRKHIKLAFVGKFIDIKDPLIIPKAISHLNKDEKSKIMVYTAGTGPLKNRFAEMCNELGIVNHHYGFINQTKMVDFYKQIDLLILPSIEGEVWGLVVNEAISQGVKVIVSDNVGARHDLVTSGQAGWVFSAGQSRLLASRIREAVSHWPWTKQAMETPSISTLVEETMRVIR